MKTKELVKMLTYKRPDGTWSEQEYIDKYIAPVADHIDGAGNYHVTIGENPSVLFSSHTDTVHRKAGYQSVYYDKKTDALKAQRSDCLGADDTTGNWLMLAMIEKQIPGLYIFHRGEECGGIGSSWIADNTPELLADIDHAIAFDRKGTEDIIATQGAECCSLTFAKQFAGMLGTEWKPAHGIFTDTANYTHLVSECTNISVGYYHQHTAREYQLVKFAQTLRDKLLAFDWHKLDAHREPVDQWSIYDNYDSKGYGGWSANDYRYGKYGDTSYRRYDNESIDYDNNRMETVDEFMGDGWDDFRAASPAQAFNTMVELVEDYPEDITAMLIDYGWTIEDIQTYIKVDNGK